MNGMASKRLNYPPFGLMFLKFTLPSAIIANPTVSFNTASITHNHKLYCKFKRILLKRISVIQLLGRDRLLGLYKAGDVDGYGMMYHFSCIILLINFIN